MMLQSPEISEEETQGGVLKSAAVREHEDVVRWTTKCKKKKSASDLNCEIYVPDLKQAVHNKPRQQPLTGVGMALINRLSKLCMCPTSSTPTKALTEDARLNQAVLECLWKTATAVNMPVTITHSLCCVGLSRGGRLLALPQKTYRNC